jgi:hypothetical protein
VPSPTDSNAGSDGGLEERLGRLGDVLWLTSVGIALSLVAVVAFLASAGLLGRVSPYLGGAALVLGLLGVLYLLFGNWDWSPGGEARQHATFLVLFVGLQAIGVAALRTSLGSDAASGIPFLVAGFVGLAVAGWLAYLDGFERLTSLTG